jgi:hypothetical protein
MVSNAQSILEHEGLIVLDHGFTLMDDERECLTFGGAGGAKNISLSPDGSTVRGVDAAFHHPARRLMARYADWARARALDIAPTYAADLQRGRTSLRNRAVSGDGLSPRKDDRRLHIDAFASQPTGGDRILRVFANINPDGEARHWRIGEPFADHARRWIDRLRRPLPGEAWALHALGVTKSRRTPYDALMLALHDAAKLDPKYQRDAPRRDVAFAAGQAWMVYTDSTVHAAIAGRYALEQTFYLPVTAMAAPGEAPLRILEGMAGKALVRRSGARRSSSDR